MMPSVGAASIWEHGVRTQNGPDKRERGDATQKRKFSQDEFAAFCIRRKYFAGRRENLRFARD